MKILIQSSIYLILLFSYIGVRAQSDSIENHPLTTHANFKGDYLKFLTRNLRYPKDARKNKIEGKVYIQFVVETDGSVNEISIVKNLYPSLDKEAERVVKLSSGKWTIAHNAGKPVRSYKKIVVEFTLNRVD